MTLMQPKSNPKPIKRSPHILPLSRDHHFGLLFCWKIRQGLKHGVDNERIREYIRYFWSNFLQKHFKEEETVLFKHVTQDPMRDEAVQQHREIEKQISHICCTENFPSDAYTKLASTVDDHIRFEERKLFPHIESILSAEQLKWVGDQLELIHSIPETDNFPDEFWVK